MAKEHFVPGQDRDISGGITAADKLAESDRGENPDVESKAAAAAAGVSHPAYVDYASALEAFEARDDIETLAARRARDNGADFNAGGFMRANAYDADGTSADAPRPGTVFGDAPDEGDTLDALVPPVTPEPDPDEEP